MPGNKEKNTHIHNGGNKKLDQMEYKELLVWAVLSTAVLQHLAADKFGPAADFGRNAFSTGQLGVHGLRKEKSSLKEWLEGHRLMG